jgi:phospholipase/carboxylesterase
MMNPNLSEAAAEWKQGRLRARPGHAAKAWEAGAGMHPLGLGSPRDGQFYVPHGVSEAASHPLLVMLHGAGGTAGHMLSAVSGMADALGIVILAPDAREKTWDVIRDDYGPDVAFIDRALEVMFGRFTIDPERISIGGFSDGASYGLSLGLANGDLIHDILAFSPGFAALIKRVGKPRIFVSQGTTDDILPPERCGRRLAHELSTEGYDVEYREFSGGHVMPPDVVDAGMRRLVD